MPGEPAGSAVSDLDDLRALAQRYSRAIDGRDIDAVAELFDPAGSVDGARGSATVPDYLETMRTSPRVFEQSMHVLGDPLIEHTEGSDTARLDTYAVVYQLRRVEAEGIEAEGIERGGDMVLGIRYLDDVIRVDGAWRIHHRQAVMLWSRDLI
jgi:SnoaL-like domain